MKTGVKAFNCLSDVLSRTTGSNSTSLFCLLELSPEPSAESLFDFLFSTARKNWISVIIGRLERVLVHVWARSAPAFYIWSTVVWNSGTSPTLVKEKKTRQKTMENGNQKSQRRDA